MRILVMCPGSWSHKLNSPERGEGRWAQNYARMLAMVGHDVYAASGIGNLLCNEDRTHHGVKLLDQGNCAGPEPYDIYIDAAWWDGRVPSAKARKYIALKWSLEGYLRDKPFPDDFYLAYPYPSHRHFFSGFASSDKTFALPTMFGTTFPKPNWAEPKIFLPGRADMNRGYQAYMPAIAEILNRYPFEGNSRSFFVETLGPTLVDREQCGLVDTAPYDQVLDTMKRCRASLPILTSGAVIEAIFQGVPPVFWEHGGFFNAFGQLLDISIPHAAPPERLLEVVERLMTNRKCHYEVTTTLQQLFSYHLFEHAIKYFDLMVESIF